MRAPPASPSLRLPLVSLCILVALKLSVSGCFSGNKADSAGESTTTTTQPDYEGDESGECSDGADNDRDGDFDCDDAGCVGSRECEGTSDGGDGEGPDSGDSGTDAEMEISTDEQDRIADLIEEANRWEWPDSGGPVEHQLPYPEGAHMGITQGTSCLGHSGSLQGSIDFNVAGGTYESSAGLHAVASAAGTVVGLETGVTGRVSGSYGNFVLLRHPDGTYTIYAHLDHGRVFVSDGEEVCAGHPLGVIGSTGESTGDHLHYEQRDAANARIRSPSFAELDPVPSGCDPCTTTTHNAECYESQNAYVASCTSGDCDVSGSLTSANLNNGTLTVRGNVASADGVSRWSLVLGGTTIAGSDFSDGRTTASINETIDLSAWSFTDGTQSLGLWVRNGEGCTGDAAVDVETLNCSPAAFEQCDSDDVYSYNECGTLGVRADNCVGSEVCVDTSSTTAACQTNAEDCANGRDDDGDGRTDCDDSDCASSSSCVSCGDGTVNQSSEQCDGSDLDGETCSTLGYSGGTLRCTSSCAFNTSSCTSTENCTNGSDDDGDGDADCDDSDCYGSSSCNTAVDSTDSSAWCSGSSRDIFRTSSISLSDIYTYPVVTATFRKCDGTSMSASKSCHIRTGSYTGSYSSSLARTSFTWSSGSSSKTVSWYAWPSASSFSAASSGDYKEFFIVCAEPTGDWNHWRAENPIYIEIQ